MAFKSSIHIIDFNEITTPKALHTYFKKEFEFPDYYGMNWDAFWDCMTELFSDNRSIHLEIHHFSKFEKKYPQNAKIMQHLLKRLKEYDTIHKYNSINICYADD